MCIDLKFVELTADVLEIFFIKYSGVVAMESSSHANRFRRPHRGQWHYSTGTGNREEGHYDIDSYFRSFQSGQPMSPALSIAVALYRTPALMGIANRVPII